MKLAGRNSALNPPVFFSTDRSKAVVPVLVFFKSFLVLFCSCIIRTFVQSVLVRFCLFPLPLRV